MKSRCLNKRMHRRVNMTTMSGDTFCGTLWEYDRHVCVLVSVEVVAPQGDVQTIPVDGELVLPMSQVRHWQFV